MKLFDLFKRKSPEERKKFLYIERDLLVFYVQCDECGEPFRGIVRKNSELFQTYGQKTGDYEISKELIGAKCHKKIQVHFSLSGNLKVIEKSIEGGNFLTRDEFFKLKEDYNDKKTV